MKQVYNAENYPQKIAIISYRISSLKDKESQMSPRGPVRWWEPRRPTAPAAELVPVNVKYEFLPSLGSPDTAKCEKASFEFLGSEEIVMDPANKPFIQLLGKSIFWKLLTSLQAI